MNNLETAIVARPTEVALQAVNKDELNRAARMIIDTVTGPYGKTLNNRQAATLALISLTTGLSPLVGELYWTDVGPQIGMLAYERKAKEYLDAYHPGTNFHVTFRSAQPQVDADFDPDKGDIAYVARLTRDDWDERWQKSFQDFLKMLTDAGLKGPEAVKEAKALAGDKPYAEYAGVVHAAEHFSAPIKDKQGKVIDWKPEMMDRHERAKKRAKKGVIKHEFPRLEIPDPLEILASNLSDRLIQQVDMTPPALETDKSPQQLQWELGYGEKPPEPVVIIQDDGSHSEPEPSPELQEAVDTALASAWPDELLDAILADPKATFKDRDKLTDALIRSTFVTPATDLPWLVRWCGTYCANRVSRDQDQATERADEVIATLMSEEGA